MDIWFIWFILAVVAAFLELAIPGFFMLSFSAAFLAAMLMALLGIDMIWQLTAAIVAMLAFIVFLRPFLYAYRTDSGRWGRARLIGSIATVTKDINPPESGRAALSGIEWEAVAVDPMTAGEKAEVASVGGAVLYLRKIRKTEAVKAAVKEADDV